ncbi:hypothetical protein O9G_001276 [Rozella allomycis CSF55]|uniref:Uncharacterized protein n=1 Tax=Rozella allomycis (strain CSF55) TaxID=988480 RepID=A0A075ATM1_ROZAC|nr:hypothetical protein O9G_001276 [Rozella allomycis CSF55]|eukprot:EPZ33525.1 hypothetical protein O9G_001276 [Rozella allomycis CSF55]
MDFVSALQNTLEIFSNDPRPYQEVIYDILNRADCLNIIFLCFQNRDLHFTGCKLLEMQLVKLNYQDNIEDFVETIWATMVEQMFTARDVRKISKWNVYVRGKTIAFSVHIFVCH